MSAHQTGSPAFPVQELFEDGKHFATHMGMTKREVIAMASMQAIISGSLAGATRCDDKSAAKAAVAFADALLAELAEGGGA